MRVKLKLKTSKKNIPFPLWWVYFSNKLPVRRETIWSHISTNYRDIRLRSFSNSKHVFKSLQLQNIAICSEKSARKTIQAELESKRGKSLMRCSIKFLLCSRYDVSGWLLLVFNGKLCPCGAFFTIHWL